MKTLLPGDKVPHFTALDDAGNVVDWNDLKGQKVIVFFYPKASSPSCTTQACNLRDYYEELKAEGYMLLGVSADSVIRQANFKKKYNFPFPLLADTNREVIDAFGVWGPKRFMGKDIIGIHRMTFLINEEGIVERVIEKVKTKEHSTQILVTANTH